MTVPRDDEEAKRYLLATVAFLVFVPISVGLAAFHVMFAAVLAVPAALAAVFLYALASREVAGSRGASGTISKAMRASVVQQQLLGAEPFRRALSMIGWRPEPWMWVRRCGLATLVIVATLLFVVLSLRAGQTSPMTPP